MSRHSRQRHSLIELIAQSFRAVFRTLSDWPKGSANARALLIGKQRSGFEALELRSMLAADVTTFQLDQFLLSDGILKVNGTEEADAIQVSQSTGTLTVTLNKNVQSYPLADVRLIEIRSGAGDDTILAGNSVTVPLHVWAGLGNDYVEGSSASDWLYGQGGNDVLEARRGNDILRAGDGDDILEGEEGKDSLYGDAGNDLLDGGLHGDRLRGGAGADQLFGGAGSDALNGGAGLDELTGGTGDDQIFEGQKQAAAVYGPQLPDALIFDEPGEFSKAPLSERDLGKAARFESTLLRGATAEALQANHGFSTASHLNLDSVTFGDVDGGLDFSLFPIDGGGSYEDPGEGEGEYANDYYGYMWIKSATGESELQLEEEGYGPLNAFTVKRAGDLDEEQWFSITLGGTASLGSDYEVEDTNGLIYGFIMGVSAWAI